MYLPESLYGTVYTSKPVLRRNT